MLFWHSEIENLSIGEVAVEGEVAGDLLLAEPIHPLAAGGRVVEEVLSDGLALLPLAEPPKFHGTVLPATAHVMNNHRLTGDLAPLPAVVPELTHVLDKLSVAAGKQVVARNYHRRVSRVLESLLTHSSRRWLRASMPHSGSVNNLLRQDRSIVRVSSRQIPILTSLRRSSI